MVDLNNNLFDDSVSNQLKQLIEDAEGVTIFTERERSGIWLHDQEWTSELRLTTLMRVALLVSRVQFQHKRQGTMTKVLKILMDFCDRMQIESIRIQAVCTPEMIQWALKNGFIPIEVTCYIENGLKYGDYVLQVSQTK